MNREFSPQLVPKLRGEEAAYFANTKLHRLVYQRCASCESSIFYLRTLCDRCGSEDLVLLESAGRGRVHSFTTQYRAGHPSLADRVPYTIVLIDLDEGYRMLADIVECSPDAVHIGMAVETVFADVTDELTLPRFRPLTGAVIETGVVG